MTERQKVVYQGQDLGAVYSEKATSFRVWAPSADQVELCIYPDGSDSPMTECIVMKADVDGTWLAIKSGDCKNLYYTYRFTRDGKTEETMDVYAHGAGVNGVRSMVVNLADTDPEGFEKDDYRNPPHTTDMIVYETSVRDFTADSSSGASQKGVFLGMVESGTTNATGDKTGIDYLKELGITHVQLMPSYDFGSVDESKSLENQYNWGYDPINYNLPEGSYSTDANDGNVRIREMKQMIQRFHQEGIGVIMDVVYNHTYSGVDSCLHKTEPYYYHRTDENGFTDGSGCGNEIASERPMVRKMIMDSLCYWVKEYHIDGFRFDLMAVLDQETMRQVREALVRIRPDIILYGEGWNGGPSALPLEERSLKAFMKNLPGIGAFSDDCRDSIRGDVFVGEANGYVSGASGMEDYVRFTVTGATEHDGVKDGLYSEGAWANSPEQCVNYVSCHDNYGLWDKLAVSCPDATLAERKAMNRLAAAMVYTAQGMPFMLSGEEMLRSKWDEKTESFVENSFNTPIKVNSMKWNLLHENADMVNYYKGLIAFRKAHAGLRMNTTEQVQKYLRFLEVHQPNVVAFLIDAAAVGDTAEQLLVVYNPNREAVRLELPDKNQWQVCIEGERAGADILRRVSEKVEVSPISAMVLVR
ncbi:MAG: type I pullulanase [Roseburia sp.]